MATVKLSKINVDTNYISMLSSLTGDTVEDILSHFSALAIKIAQYALDKGNARYIQKKMVSTYKESDIPFRLDVMQVEDTGLSITNRKKSPTPINFVVHIGFPSDRSWINYANLVDLIFERETGLSDQVFAMPPLKKKIPYGVK
jgi:hypothetical protein